MHVLVTRRPNSVVKKGEASLWCLKSDRTAIPLVNDLEFITIFFIKGMIPGKVLVKHELCFIFASDMVCRPFLHIPYQRVSYINTKLAMIIVYNSFEKKPTKISILYPEQIPHPQPHPDVSLVHTTNGNLRVWFTKRANIDL